MYKPSWLRLKKVLRAIAKYGDDAFPGTRRLAKDTGIPDRTIARLIVQAEGLGLIHRTFTDQRRSPTYAFGAPVCAPVSGESGAEQVLRTCSPTSNRYEVQASSGRRSRQETRKLNRYDGTCCVCSFPVQAGEGFLHGREPVHRFCDSGTPDLEKLQEDRVNKQWQQEQARDMATPAFGEDPEAPLAPTAVVRTDPASRLARHFESRWVADVLRTYPDWTKYRCMHLGAAIGYIRSQFLAKGYSYEHVEAYIDAFIDDLCDRVSPTAISPGQTGWQRFTGWWGSVEIEDPVLIKARKDQLASWVAQAAAQNQPSMLEILENAPKRLTGSGG